jgi:hypothetical protein
MGTTRVPPDDRHEHQTCDAARVSATCRDVSRYRHQELARLHPYAVAAGVPTPAQNASTGRSRARNRRSSPPVTVPKAALNINRPLTS